jgi:hypothetical protein
MTFCANIKSCINLNTGHGDKTTKEVKTAKFCGVQIDSNLKKSTEYIVHKLSSSHFAMGTVTSLMKIETLKLVYFPYVHSITSYGLIFWENSTDCKKRLCIQRKIIKIMACIKWRVSCKVLFKKFGILPLASKFLLLL